MPPHTLITNRKKKIMTTTLSKEGIYSLIDKDLKKGREENGEYELTAEELESFTHRLDRPILKLVIEHPNTSSATLLKLAKHPEVTHYFKSIIPLNKNTPVEALRILMPTPSNTHVAGHHLATPEMLAELSTHENAQVRKSVAGNANTPKRVLLNLAEDSNWEVLESVAGNPNTYQKYLNVIFKKANFIVNGKHKIPLDYGLIRTAREVLDSLAMRESNSESMWKRLCKALGKHRVYSCICSAENKQQS